MKKLCQAYKQDLPNKISTILLLWESLKKDSWNLEKLSQLYYLVHNMAGSGTIFGCEDVANIATRAEALLYLCMRTAAVPNLEDKLAIDKVLQAFAAGLKPVCQN